jgi:6-pyruvoyltetrahydropterin/6-carboxytetrahydropterin synthase
VPSTLSRTTRFSIHPSEADKGALNKENTFASAPSPRGLAAWYETVVEIQGDPDPISGYIIGIDKIDKAVRMTVLEPLRKALRGEDTRDLPSLVLELASETQHTLRRSISGFKLKITPRHEIGWVNEEHGRMPEPGETMSTDELKLMIRIQFEFAAAHRLHCPEESDEWNKKAFGKCNNPAGHGHNYRVEVCVTPEVDEDGRTRMTFEDVETVVKKEVIDRFDHRNLNEQCEEFSQMNPSVENITSVSRDLLLGPLADAGGALREITIWETEKTSCTCRV